MVGDLHPLSLATDIHVVYHLKSHLEGQGEFNRQIHGIKKKAQKIMLFEGAKKNIQYLHPPVNRNLIAKYME